VVNGKDSSTGTGFGTQNPLTKQARVRRISNEQQIEHGYAGGWNPV